MNFPAVEPKALARLHEPFSDPDWLFELKHDGFRALAYVSSNKCELVSRNGNVFKRFDALAGEMESTLGTTSAIIDGEIVCLDSDGRSVFNELLFHHKESYFFAFDLLWLNGRDLRSRPLIERKQHLRRLIPEQSNRLLYCDHVDENGEG